MYKEASEEDRMAGGRKRIAGRFRALLAVTFLLIVVFAVPASRHALLGFFNLKQSESEEGVYYTCPMHPDIRLPQPGECPICGMTLVKKEVGDEEQSGRVSVTAQQMQLTGVTIEPLEVKALAKEIDTYGKIDYDETKLGIVSAWVGGRIDKLYVNFTGVTVNKGHPLVYLYSPELISTEKEYLLAMENLRKIEKGGFKDAVKDAQSLVNSTKQRLLWWGLSEKQINAIGRSGKIQDHMTINAPIGGTVILKHAYEGMYVKEGDELFHIADLSRVWFYADIYEDEIPFLYQEREDDYYECPMHPEVQSNVPTRCPKCGMDLLRANRSVKVEISTRAFPGELFEGSISFTDPFLNPETRTVRIRVNIDNPDLRLKPDMFARARILLPAGEVLAVPENAVIHSGKRKIVLVEEERGKFRPQPVKLGRLWLNDLEREEAEIKKLAFQKEAFRYHEVLDGLEEGEKVVTSGNFLIGSESQLQGALAKMIEEYDKKEDEEFSKERQEREQEVSYEFVNESSIDVILEAYFGIGSTLAHDKLEGIPELAQKIFSQAASKPIKDTAEPLKHALHKNDIKETRNQFRELSDALIAYVEKNKSTISTLPYLLYCPMVDASWLQDNKQTANPYYGSMMYKCGRVVAWDQE